MADLKEYGAPRRREGCNKYKVMTVTTFVIVLAAATGAVLAYTNVITVPGLSPAANDASPSPSPTPNIRGAAGAPGGGRLPVEKQVLGHSGVVAADPNEKGAGPVKSWALLRPIAARPACVDVREFPADVQVRLMNAVRANEKATGSNVALVEASACKGALLARRPDASGASSKDFGVPADDVTAGANLNINMNVVTKAGGRQLGGDAAAPSPATTSEARQLVSLVELNLMTAAALPAPVRYIYGQNLAALSTFFDKILDIDWTEYFDNQCRHRYKDSNMQNKVEFDFRPNGGRCKLSTKNNKAASYYKPCLYHPMVAPTSIGACVGNDCGSTMQAKSDEMYRSSVSVVRFDQPKKTKEAVVRTNVGLGANDADKRKVQVAAAAFSTNPAASHCPAAPWTHRTLLGGTSLGGGAADFSDFWRVHANDQNKGFQGREYVENYPHNLVMDTEVNLIAQLEDEIKKAVKAEKPDANSVSAEVKILDPRSFSVYTTMTLDKNKWYTATKYIQTRTQYQIVHHKNTIQVGIFHRSWAWQTSSSVFWFVADALDDGASAMARQVSQQVASTLADQFAESLPAGPAAGSVVAASTTTLTLGEDGKVFALVAF